jgi:hypothetical protein
MAHVFWFRSLNEKACVWFDGSPPGICGRQVGTETMFSSSTSFPFSPWPRRRTANR